METHVLLVSLLVYSTNVVVPQWRLLTTASPARHWTTLRRLISLHRLKKVTKMYSFYTVPLSTTEYNVHGTRTVAGVNPVP
jgi:hypothetical protein